jgi:UDP-N-acetyl-2-amino-2-deoxyglucuronate dehydrogenase
LSRTLIILRHALTEKKHLMSISSLPRGHLRYAIIGGGAEIAPTHIAALRRLNADIVGLSDIAPERAAARAAELGCTVYGDHNQMLKETNPDVAVICVPHPLHVPIAIDCLQAGAHILVEKPIAVEVAEADQLIAAAEINGRILAVNFQHRTRPAVEFVRDFIASGQLGALVRVLVTEPWLRTYAYYRSATWRGSWTGEGGGVLMNQSSHTLDLLCHLVGQPARVWGWVRTRFQPMECEDTAQAMLEYPNGAPGYFAASTADAGGPRRIEIVGERAAVEMVEDRLTIKRFEPAMQDFIANDPRLFSSPDITTEVLDLPAGEDSGNHYAVYRDLEVALVEGRQPRCSGREALMSLELANAIILSSFTEQPVRLPVDRTAYHRLLNDLRTGAFQR